MNQENRFPSYELNYDKFLFMTFQKKLENINEDQSSITPKRPLLSRDRVMGTLIEVSPLSDHNSRFELSKPATTPVQFIRTDVSCSSFVDNHTFRVSSPPSSRSTVIDDDDDENTCIPVYTQRKARPAPSTTWKAPIPIPKSSSLLRTNMEPLLPVPELPPTPPLVSFQPAIRARIPFNLSSTNSIDKQAHAYTIWLNSLFTPVDFMCTTTANQSVTKTLKSLAELDRWYALRDRAREVFTHDIQSITAKISADIDIDHCRINPKADLNFSARSINRQALLNFISSYNRIWFRLAMEVIFPINIENYHQMKSAIEQYLLQSTGQTSVVTNENHSKKICFNNNNKTASTQIRLTMKNLIIMIIFLERAKLLRLIDNDPCLYNRDSKFKSTKESLDVLSRDFISSDTNLLRRLKLAGYEPIYRQTSLDEFNYLIGNNENRLFEDLKDGIRLTRCAQILLASTNEHVARLDLSTKLKCPVVNLVHKLLNIDQAWELLQTYGHVNLTGILNKDIMNGNKQRTLELLWRVFIVCYLPKHLSPMEKLNKELALLSQNLSPSSAEQQLLNVDLIPLQKQQINFTPIIHFLIKWVQLICAHYKFWIYDLQESFADGRAFLYIISYYLPSLCDYTRDIKHLTTLATCQTRDEHIQFNLELGQTQSLNIYEKNVKSNFRFLEECIKQFGTFSSDLIKYENYAKDVPDERCTIMILAMLAHDLIFSNHHDEIDFRHQSIFVELNEKYSKNEGHTREEIEIIREDSIISSEISLLPDTPVEEILTLKHSISSTTITYPSKDTHLIPIIQSEEEQNEVLDTMTYDILDRLELLSELNDDDDEDEDSFDSARSSSTAKLDHRRTSIAATMASLSLDDFVELEKTIEKEENKTTNTSLILPNQTISSDIDSNESNKFDETCFADPINKKIIKETLILFLSSHQQRIENDQNTNKQQTDDERETHAAQILQAHWRGYQIRLENKRNDHPVLPILEKLRAHHSTLTLREHMMKIVREFSEISATSVTAYLHFLHDIESIISGCVEIRSLIAERGFLRLFFILIRCSNRSDPSTILLGKILHILQLFTVKHDLIMKLIDKGEQIKDFLMLLLKYYQNNGWEIFEQICLLLQTIVNDEKARRILRSNQSFTEAIEYIYKRLFNSISLGDEKHRQLTPKKRISLFNPLAKMMRSSVLVQNENIRKQNLLSIEQFMNIFYRD